MKPCLMPVALLAALNAAAPVSARAAPVPAATPSGRPVSCLRVTDISESRVRSDQVIDFYTRSGKVYRNTLPNSCPRLGFEQAFSYNATNSQLCSVDIVQVLDRSLRLPGAACGLGEFQPVAGLAR